VTKFTSRLMTKTREPSTRVGACECEVYSWQRKYHGKFYPHGFDASCQMMRTDTEPHNITGFSIRKYGHAEDGVYSFSEEGVRQYLPNGPWGTERITSTTGGIVTQCNYDQVNNLALIHAKSCGLRVQFRPFDIAKGRYQTLLNGVAWSIDKKHMPALIDNSRTIVSAPRQYSGVPLYDQMAATTQLTVEEYFLIRAMTSDVDQNHPDSSPECSGLSASFLTCDTEETKKRAMDQCKWMLHSQAFIKCVDRDDPTADFLLKLVRRCFDQACGTLRSCDSADSFRRDLVNLPANCKTTTFLNKVHKLRTWLMTDEFC